MNLTINNSINNKLNFQARIKIDKPDVTKMLLTGAGLVSTGLYSAQSGFQEDITGSLLVPGGNGELISMNDIQSVKEYVEEGCNLIEKHNDYLEAHDGKPSDLEAINRFCGSIGLVSSAFGTGLLNIASKVLYTNKDDLSDNKNKELPS